MFTNEDHAAFQRDFFRKARKTYGDVITDNFLDDDCLMYVGAQLLRGLDYL